jgi:hypothetical protein
MGFLHHRGYIIQKKSKAEISPQRAQRAQRGIIQKVKKRKYKKEFKENLNFIILRVLCGFRGEYF